MKAATGIMKTAIGILALFMLAVPSTILAQNYPNKTIRVIIGYAPGGSTDIVGRYFAPKLSERLGKPVVVENRPGATGAIGADIVAKAPPDGYTLYLAQSAFATNAALQKDLPYDSIKSFAPIALIGSATHVFVVHSSVPVNSVKEFIALARQKPGQLIFACTGYGGSNHLDAELLKMNADIDINIVQFKGAGQAVIDLIGGHSHAMLVAAPATLPHITSGRLKALAVSGQKHSVSLPGVPTLSEAGVPGRNEGMWYGFFAPAGTPALIVDRLTNEIKTILASDEATTFFTNQVMEKDYMGPKEFGLFVEESIAQWSSVVKRANLKLDK
jgi:tripartite-type tricarboxylate transporter receptor subunit TctC